MNEYAYDVHLTVSKVLTETEKNKLMLGVSRAIRDVLGEAKGGTLLICSDKKEDNMSENRG